MNDRLDSILDKMAQLEAELHQELKSCEERFQICFVASVEEIKRSALDAQQQLEQRTSRFLRATFWLNLLSLPLIYAMIIPLVFLDLALTLYQHVCFRIYQIPRSRRRDHFIIDRQFLDNLNVVDKFNCVYCGYGNGVISYAREILSRTEQYWCPIKHAQKTRNASKRYNDFLDYGDTEEYHQKLDDYRDRLKDEEE